MLDELVKENLINLEIISKFHKDSKIFTQGRLINIHSNNWYTSLQRRFQSEGKSENVDRVEKIIIHTIELSEALITADAKQEKKDTTIKLKQLLMHAEKAVQGIENLRNVYSQDKQITSRLTIILS